MGASNRSKCARKLRARSKMFHSDPMLLILSMTLPATDTLSHNLFLIDPMPKGHRCVSTWLPNQPR